MIISKVHKKRLQQLAGVIKENINTADENLEEISVNDIELPKDYIHDHFNEKIWNENDELHQEIRDKLEDIARDFYEYLEVKVPIEDIWFIGSLTNYNWTNFSDIDLHVLIDYTKFDEDENFIKNYLIDRKTLWNDRHNIKIKGFDVELYAQNSNEIPNSSGVYSIQDNKWIKKPSLEKPEVDRESVKSKVKNIIDRIEEIEGLQDPEKSYKKGEILKEKIKKMRQSGLDKGGEFSSENLAFKYLRNNGYLERLFNVIANSYDKNMSITEEENSATQEYNENKNLVLADEVLNIIKNLDGQQNRFNEEDLAKKIYKFPFYELTEIAMATLNTNEFPTNQSLVNDYIEKTKNNPDYPPIVFDPELNSIIDGMHRIKALESLGYDSVRAYVGVRNIKNQNNMSINENVRSIIRKDLNEFFNAKGFHASIEDWINKWKEKGVDVNYESGEKIISEDSLKGGKADRKDSDDFDERELEIGVAVESEHTKNKELAKEIAMDHLEENPVYYKNLVEKGVVDEEEAIKIYKKHYGTEKLKEENIEEKFASKKQQRYFYAMSNKPGKMGKKFKKMAKEFSKETDFDKLNEGEDVNSFNSYNIERLKNVSKIVYGITGDEEMAGDMVLSQNNSTIHIPINNNIDKKIFDKLINALNERGYSVEKINDSELEIDLANPIFSLNEDEDSFYQLSPIQHKLFLEKNIQDEHENNVGTIKDFILLCNIQNEIKEPTIVFLRGSRKGSALKTTASYNTGNHHVHVYCKGRHVVDILRSIAHELMHMKQNLDGRLNDNSGDDGSPEENEAHSFAGLMIRKFGKEKPSIYENYKNNKKGVI
jgi:ParB-like chromosome segregation protein Spo0J